MVVLEQEQLFLAQEEPEKLGQARVCTDKTAYVKLTLEPLDRFLLKAILLISFAKEIYLASQTLPKRPLVVLEILSLLAQTFNVICFKPVCKQVLSICCQFSLQTALEV